MHRPNDEEIANGDEPSLDEDVVDEIGQAAGVTYEEGEPLRAGRKEEARDEHRWELDPASAEDYQERGAAAGATTPREPLLKMRHHDRYDRTKG